MSAACPLTGTFVKPGKSTKVKSTTLGEKIDKLMGVSLTFLVVEPAIVSVLRSISCLISWKSNIFLFGKWVNSPYS